MEAREALLYGVSAADGDTEIMDPATGEVIGRHTFGTAADVKAAVDQAAAAQPAWAALTDQERVGYLLRCADAMEADAEELAYAVSREQGKTMSGIGARYETRAASAGSALTAALPLPVEVLVDDGATYAEMHYRPIGVVGAITPWNWPLIIAIWQIAPSLRMGNTVVQKPSEYTTLCGLALIEVLNEVPARRRARPGHRRGRGRRRPRQEQAGRQDHVHRLGQDRHEGRRGEARATCPGSPWSSAATTRA